MSRREVRLEFKDPETLVAAVINWKGEAEPDDLVVYWSGNGSAPQFIKREVGKISGLLFCQRVVRRQVKGYSVRVTEYLAVKSKR